MAKYDKTNFYWLQLKEDFFEEDAINWLEEQPNGKEYCLFYLKLCLKSLKTSGVMIRQVGDMFIPYDCKKLAEITNTDIDTVVVAMELLKKSGLIKILDNGELYLTNVEKMIGFQSIGAFKKQQQRLISRQTVDICPPDIDIEKDIELDIDKEKNIANKLQPPPQKEEKHKYGQYQHILLTDAQFEKLVNDFGKKNVDLMIKKLDEAIEIKGYKYKNHNLVLRGWVLSDLKKTSQWQKKESVELVVDTTEQDKQMEEMLEDEQSKKDFENFMKSRNVGNLFKSF